MKSEHPLAVQPQQEVELSRHGMEFLFCLSVIVVVVGQGVEAIWVMIEGPESIQMHIITDFQRQASHDYASAEPHCSQALGTPEDGQTLEVCRVEEDWPGGAFKVLNAVVGPHGNRSVVAIGEGRKEQQGVAIAAQALHKWSSTPHESSIPEIKGGDVKQQNKRNIIMLLCGDIHPLSHFSRRMLGFAVTRSVLMPTCFS